MKKLFVYFMFLTVVCQYSFGSNPVLVAGSQEKLANGMTVETYKFEKSFAFKGKNSLCDESEFDYEIEWPIDGPQPLLNECRKWILQQFEANEDLINGVLSSNSLQLVLEERINQNSPEYDEESDQSNGVVEDRIEIKIKADDKRTSISSQMMESWCGNWRGMLPIDHSFNILNSGEIMSYSMFPPIEKMRPYLWQYMKVFDEPCDVSGYPELENLEFPSNHPTITENGLEFIWGPYEVSPGIQFSSEVPYTDVLRLISKEGLVFIPQTAIEDFKKHSNEDLTKEILLSYANNDITCAQNEYISQEFAEILNLADQIPTDNPGGIGTYDEITWYWEEDGERDCLDSGFTGAEIISKNENTAKGRLKYKRCDGGIKYFDVDLVKEIFVYPSGLEASRWVVDDFNDKKGELLDSLNSAADEFSNGLGQSLMNDPDVSGDMSVAEKREYLQEVDEFLKAYNKFKRTK